MINKPTKPTDLNGEHGHLWDFMAHMNDRIDKLYMLGFTVLAGIIGTLVAVLLK